MTSQNYLIDKKRNNAVDVAKVFAAILILSLHTHPFAELNESISFLVSQVLARIGVPFFFLCTGYFIGIKLDGKTNTTILRNTVNRYLLIFCFWSILYMPITFTVEYEYNESLLVNVLTFIQKVIFLAPAFMWYIMAVIVALLIFRKIYCWHRKFVVLLIMSLYSLGCLGNTYYPIIESNIIGTIYKYYFSVFLTTRNGLFFGLPFVMTGCLISEYYKNKSTSIKKILIWGGLFGFLYFIEVFFVDNLFGSFQIDKSMYLFLFPFSVVIFISVIFLDKKVLIKNTKHISYMSSCIYCMQYGTIFVIKKVFEVFLKIDIVKLPTLMYVLVLIGTCVVGFMVTKTEKLKLLKKVL